MNNSLELHRYYDETVITGESSVINTGIHALHISTGVAVTIQWGEGNTVWHYNLRDEDWNEALADGLAKGSLGVLANRIKQASWHSHPQESDMISGWHDYILALRNRGRQDSEALVAS